MKNRFNSKKYLEYIYSTVSLIFIFFILSLIETVKTSGLQTFAFKLLNDLAFGLLVGLLFFPIYIVLNSIKKSFGITFIKVLFSIICVIQLGLIGYSLTTHLNLGADLIGYNLNDVYHTFTSSVSISFTFFLPFIIIPFVYLGLNYLLNRFGQKINSLILLSSIIILGSLGFLVPNNNKPTYKNKLHFLISDIIRSKNDMDMASGENISFKTEYPLEKSFDKTNDVLAPFFNVKTEKPNIVFIIAEGLGRDFTDDGEYKGFTPFLDSLTTKSLYWKNFISNAGRTFGALPSIMGSLPFGENGFMEIQPTPKHNSLISILKSNGYTTSYYCGDDSNFDRKNKFLEYNGIDNLIDIYKYGPGYVMTKKNSGGFTWGYPDGEIFRKTLTELKNKKQPRLDIIMTQSNHEPFDFPTKNIYLKKVEQIINTKTDSEKSKYREYKDIFACLLYTDNSIKEFIKAYSKKPEYANTIFVITGDHRLIPIPNKNNLSRFHVPLYIFSPMLKKTAQFKSISSHRDITPSLVSFLLNKYQFNKLEKTTWLGHGLDTVRHFRSIQNIPLMRYKGRINDYVDHEYFYSDGSMYKIDENLNITETDNPNQVKVVNSFNDFKKLNIYLTAKNKISRYGLTFKKTEYNFTPKELAIIKSLSKGLSKDQTFFLARELAFKKEHEKTRLLCNYILNDIPNYGDVRILKARTLAWDKNYSLAEKELLEAIARTPFYYDSYLALMDVYNWSDQNRKAIKIGKKALVNKIGNPEIGLKLAQAYNRTNNKIQAKKVIDSLLKVYPTNQDYQSFKISLK